MAFPILKIEISIYIYKFIVGERSYINNFYLK